MNTELLKIEKSALRLSNQEKARLADKLLQSIYGHVDPEIEQAWIEEVQRRKASLEKGEATLKDSSDVMKEARERLKR